MRDLTDYIILKSNDSFIFKVPHPDFFDNVQSSNEINELFNVLKKLEFDHCSELVLFKTSFGELGVIGEGFTSWYPKEKPALGMKLVEFEPPVNLNLLNMKPAKGPGFCRIELSPLNKEMVLFFLKGNQRNWDHNFKKTDTLIKSISNYLECSTFNVIEQYNA